MHIKHSFTPQPLLFKIFMLTKLELLLQRFPKCIPAQQGHSSLWTQEWLIGHFSSLQFVTIGKRDLCLNHRDSPLELYATGDSPCWPSRALSDIHSSSHQWLETWQEVHARRALSYPNLISKWEDRKESACY